MIASSKAWSRSRSAALWRASSESTLATILSPCDDDQTTFGPRGLGRLSATRTRYAIASPGFIAKGARLSDACPFADFVPSPFRASLTDPEVGPVDPFARSIA